LKDACIGIVVCATLMFAVRYTYQIWKQKVHPTLSTWIIFLLGSGSSLATYAVAEKHDFRSGILNTMDVIVTTIVLLATMVWGNRELRFKPFEKWYLIFLVMVVAYGIATGDAWSSNLFAQALISFGFIPTLQRLITEKRNTESFTAWGVEIIAGLAALYPAIVGGNWLAIIYSLRSTALVTMTLSIMTYYALRSRRRVPGV
jgi:hypothetical protein